MLTLRGFLGSLFSLRHEVVLLTVFVLLLDHWKTLTPRSVMPTVEAEKAGLNFFSFFFLLG